MKNNSKKESNRLSVFYIALCCCVLAIGVAGYISESISVDKTSTVADNVEIYTPKPVYTTAPIATIAPAEEIPVFNDEFPPLSINAQIYEDEVEPVVEDYTFDNPDITAVNAVAEVFDEIIMPIDGEILQPYTDTPYYNEVMGDWRTHNGVDIAAEEGREVICASNGEVKSIDATVYGTQITISHDDGFESVYSQLEPVSSLKEGGNVRCGDVIGTVTAARGEPVKDTHLHFEVLHEGNYIDPADFISD